MIRIRVYWLLCIVFLGIAYYLFSKKNDIFYSYRKQNMVEVYEKIKEEIIQKDSIVIYTYGLKSSHGTQFRTIELPILGKLKHEYISEDRKFNTILIQSESFKFKKKQYLISKYKLDEVASIDEEAYIYFNQKIGLVKVRSIAWGGIIQLEKSSVLDSDELWALHEFVRRNMRKKH